MANGQYMLSLPGHSDNVKFKKNCYLPYIININTQIKHVLKTIKFVKIVIRNYLQNKSLNGEFEFLFFCFFLQWRDKNGTICNCKNRPLPNSKLKSCVSNSSGYVLVSAVQMFGFSNQSR